MQNYSPQRREALAGFLALPLVVRALSANASALPKILVTKDPNCGCCGKWVEHLRGAGFTVDTVETSDINSIKAKLGVPPDLASCHTAEAGGYVLEGHVPDSAIRRLLAEKPAARGLAVPEMPVGSPGMEVDGMAPEQSTVFLFGEFGKRPYAKYSGTRELPT